MTRYLVLSDLHGNLSALEAILATRAARSCSRIISLGDAVNFGPRPREVHERLSGLGALMLLGNHEERLGHLADFAGYNWNGLLWTAERLAEYAPALAALPTDVRLGPMLCTHGVPGDPYLLMDAATIGSLLPGLPEGVTLLLSGHRHVCWRVTAGGRTAFNPGSAGLTEMAGFGGIAPFALLELDGENWRLTRCAAAYDPAEEARAFLRGGLAEAAPEVSRAVWQIMRRGEETVLPLMAHVNRTAKALGLAFGSEEAWHAADASFPWPEPVDSRTFWKQCRETFSS